MIDDSALQFDEGWYAAASGPGKPAIEGLEDVPTGVDFR